MAAFKISAENIYIKESCIIFCCFILMFHARVTYSQSPYTDIQFKMSDTASYSFSLAMYNSGKNDLVSSLEGSTKILLTENKLERTITGTGNEFYTGNQWFSTDRVFQIKITKESEYGEMNIVFPVEKFSWVTNIDLGTIQFKEGYYEVPLAYSAIKESSTNLTIDINYDWAVTENLNKRIFITPGMPKDE